MRYKNVHLDNLDAGLGIHEAELAEMFEDSKVFHIGCLTGKIPSRCAEGSSGCEDYPMAIKYAKRRGVKILKETEGVPSKSYDVVIIDPTYHPEYHDVLVHEAVRIATKIIVYGVVHDNGMPYEYDNCPEVAINDKYMGIKVDEYSDSAEE